MVLPTVASRSPTICIRPFQPSDIEILQKLYYDVFPFRSDEKLFQGFLHRKDVVSWVAVDQSHGDGKSDKIVGFVIARSVHAKESEIANLLKDVSPTTSAVFILALGVLENCRNRGVGTLLIHAVINHAYGTPNCCAVYLHVISENDPATCLYKKMEFALMRTLEAYYLIDGQGYDGYLFVHFVNHFKIE